MGFHDDFDQEFDLKKAHGRNRFDRRIEKKAIDMGAWSRSFRQGRAPHVQWAVKFEQKPDTDATIVQQAEADVKAEPAPKHPSRRIREEDPKAVAYAKTHKVETAPESPLPVQNKEKCELISAALSKKMQRGLRRTHKAEAGRQKETQSRGKVSQTHDMEESLCDYYAARGVSLLSTKDDSVFFKGNLPNGCKRSRTSNSEKRARKAAKLASEKLETPEDTDDFVIVSTGLVRCSAECITIMPDQGMEIASMSAEDKSDDDVILVEEMHENDLPDDWEILLL